MVFEFGDVIPEKDIPNALLKDWKECTVDGRNILSIRNEVNDVQYQYYVTPLMYALMTEQYDLAKQLLEAGCDTFFWVDNTCYCAGDIDSELSQKYTISFPCYLLRRKEIPGELRNLLWSRMNEELQERDTLCFWNDLPDPNRFFPKEPPLFLRDELSTVAREYVYYWNTKQLVNRFPKIAYKLESGLTRIPFSLDTRRKLQRLLTKLYRDDAEKLSDLFFLFSLCEEDVYCSFELQNEYEKQKEIEVFLKQYEYIAKFYQQNQMLRQAFFQYILVDLSWLLSFATTVERKRIFEFVKQYYEPSCDVACVALNVLECGSQEFIDRTHLFRVAADKPLYLMVDNEITKEYIGYVVGILWNAAKFDDYDRKTKFKKWLSDFNWIEYKYPHTLPFAMNRLFDQEDVELVVLATQKGLLPTCRCEEYIQYCMDEKLMQFIPFLLYLRSELQAE